MPTFNLLHEPWIPVLLMSGRQTALSLPEVLERAHEVREVADPSPLVTVALHRLLLAVIHRAFGPRDEAAWERLAQAGRFDVIAVQRYLASVEQRFDLLDAQRPFYQAPGLPGHLAAPVGRLAPEQATGRQATVWDHHQDHEPGAASLARAACWLIAHHAFCLSGCLCDGKRLTGVPAGPLTHAAIFMPAGQSLYETLLINLVTYDPAGHTPLPVVGEDLPAWEQPSPPSPEAPPAGYLDYLTWQTRRIQLLPSSDGGVSEVVVMPGRSFNLRSLSADPLLAYWRDERLADVWRPVRLNSERDWWSQVVQSLRPSQGRWRRPLVLETLARRSARGALPPGAALGLCVLGLAGEQARVDFWGRERRALPARMLHDPHMLADFEVALQAAQRTYCIVRARLVELAGQLEGEPGGTAQRVASEAAEAFWSGLRGPIEALPRQLAGTLEDRDEVLRQWDQLVVHEACRSWQRGLAVMPRGPRRWREQSLAQERLRVALQQQAASDSLPEIAS